MENFLILFEQAIIKQKELVGEKIAYEQAKKAGLSVTQDGRIVSIAGNPQLVLMRLIKCFAAGGNLAALSACTPLIDELLQLSQEDPENAVSAEPAEVDLS